MRYILSYDEVLETCAEGTWQRAAAQEAISHIVSDAGQSFPCVFAVRAVAQNGFRFCFAEDYEGSNVGPALTEFLRNACDVGPYASLSYVFPPGPVEELVAYHARFWAVLTRLHTVDQRPWPDEIPYSLHHTDWTFCFDGEPVFPLCLTPAHVKKRTRYAGNFTISFQPRWTFKHHLPNAKIMQRYSRLIQGRIASFDASDISPYLGLYGEGFLDAEKYFFHDDNLPMEIPSGLR